MFIVDVPNATICERGVPEWIYVAEFETKQEAINFCRRYYGADADGNVNLITEVTEDND